MRELDFNPTLPALPPLQAKLATIIADFGGTMGAIFAVHPGENETQINLVVDYGLSPVFTGTFACFLLSDGFFPPTVVEEDVIITDIAQASGNVAVPMLASLYNEGARSLLTTRFGDGGATVRFLLIAATEPNVLGEEIKEQLRTASQSLLPLLTDPPHVPTFPTRSVHVPSLTRAASDDDLEQLLAAMMEAEEESFRHNADLIALNSISTKLARTFNLNKVLDGIMAEIKDMLSVTAAWLYLIDPLSPDRLILRACDGLSERYSQGRQRIFIGDGIEGQVAQLNQPLFIEDALQHRLRCEILVDQEQMRAIATVPLTCEVEHDGLEEQQVVGVLTVSMNHTYPWQSREIRLLTAVANHLALATHNASLYNQVQDTSERLAASNQLLQELNKQLLTVQFTTPKKQPPQATSG
jgi:hypothetical protein